MKSVEKIIQNNKEVISEIKELDKQYCENIKNIGKLQLDNVKIKTKTSELRTKLRIVVLPKERKLTREERERIIKDRGNKCEECPITDNLTVHHKVKLAHGGTNDPKNLQVLCLDCHRKKHPINDTQIDRGEIYLK